MLISGPVIMAVQPSKERIYLQQEQRKRMRRRQMFCEYSELHENRM